MWFVLPGILFMLVFFIYPLTYGVGLSFQGVAGPGSAYRDFLTNNFPHDSGSLSSLWITLELAVPGALINVAAALPIAWRMRGPLRGKRLITAVVMVPMTLGAVFVAEGMNTFLGATGWFNRLLLDLHLVDQPLQLTGNFAGVLIAIVVTGFPFAFLLMLGYVSGIDPSLEQAAAILGAPPWQRFRLITFPLLLPGLTITFCLSFVLAFAVFPSATLVGNDAGPTRVISKIAYTEYANGHYANASATAIVMGVAQLVILGLVMLARSRLYRGSTAGGKG
jgi:putative spermidine/putrescine transport system permease protein